MSDQLPEKPPGILVNVIVGRIAVADLPMHRHGAIGARREAQEQLLQVGPVIFVITKRDVGRSARLVERWLLGIVSAEGGRGGVLVELPQVNAKHANHSHNQQEKSCFFSSGAARLIF